MPFGQKCQPAPKCATNTDATDLCHGTQRVVLCAPLTYRTIRVNNCVSHSMATRDL